MDEEGRGFEPRRWQLIQDVRFSFVVSNRMEEFDGICDSRNKRSFESTFFECVAPSTNIININVMNEKYRSYMVEKEASPQRTAT